MSTPSTSNVIELDGRRRSHKIDLARRGRWEVTSVGLDPNLQLVGGDPWGTSTYTGLVVPAASTSSLGGARFRYLFMLARASFPFGCKARLKGLRLYASLRGQTDAGFVEELPITSPLWRFPDANLTFHVRVVPMRQIDTRNPLNADSLMFRDAVAPSLLFQTLGPYSPPNGGRPWGKALAASLGTIHGLPYPWRDSQVELELDVPIPPGNDVAVYCSAAQHDTSVSAPTLTTQQAAAATPETAFWSAFTNVQYNRVAAGMTFEDEVL